MKGKTVKVSGPLIVAEGMADAKMYDVVRVSAEGLIGEIIELKGSRASIQVYEETGMLGVGEDVISTHEPLSVELAPGLLEGIFDGIQRPLVKLMNASGVKIKRGVNADPVDREKKWEFIPLLKAGVKVEYGDIIGSVFENEIIEHKIMIPFGVSGEITKIESGNFNVTETIAIVKNKNETHNICMLQRWPVRKARPYKEKLSAEIPLITGQRVIDTLFPIAKGGVAAVPGPFGSGKTIVQHQLAKWSDADMVVYVGCGERGNEMTDVLNEFPHLTDPKSGKSLMKRTILIANTSDMPVAAREASIYTGITIAEYFRDMGLNVAIMADSTSRWAEALREMSGRLEEMPGEEGYPAYLSSRLAEFYERAGMFLLCGSNQRVGSITAIGAISPPGGDMSEPVSQATLRIVKVFWGLSASLAYKRHFPAIDWIMSYSLYSDRLKNWFSKNIDENWNENRLHAQTILQEEAKLEEIARLVGIESLSGKDRLIMETAKSLKEDYLHQNAFHEIDTYASLEKQNKMLKLLLSYHFKALDALNKGVKLTQLLQVRARENIGRSKYIPENQLEKFDQIEKSMANEIAALMSPSYN